MNDRDLFKKTFDAVPAPQYLAARAAVRAHEKTPRRSPRRALRTAVLIVLAVALLSVAAAAGFFGSKTDYVDVCNAELDELRALGLFRAEFQIEESSLVADPDTLGEDNLYVGEVASHGDVGVVQYSVKADMDTGKINGLMLLVRPGEGEEPVRILENGWRIYANFGAVMDTNMTVGEYCEIWRQYRGYERFELPEGVDPGTRLLDTRELDAWSFSMEGNGIKIPFYRSGEAKPGYAWISYEPTAMGASICFGDVSLKG